MPTLTDQQSRDVQRETLEWVLMLTSASREHPSPVHWIQDCVTERWAWLTKQDERRQG
jgi:hypothetical protein